MKCICGCGKSVTREGQKYFRNHKANGATVTVAASNPTVTLSLKPRSSLQETINELTRRRDNIADLIAKLREVY